MHSEYSIGLKGLGAAEFGRIFLVKNHPRYYLDTPSQTAENRIQTAGYS